MNLSKILEVILDLALRDRAGNKADPFEGMPESFRTRIRDAKRELLRLNGLAADEFDFERVDASGPQAALGLYEALIEKGLRYEPEVRKILNASPIKHKDLQYKEWEAALRGELLPSFGDGTHIAQVLTDCEYAQATVKKIMTMKMAQRAAKKDAPGVFERLHLIMMWNDGCLNLRDQADIVYKEAERAFLTSSEKFARRSKAKNLERNAALAAEGGGEVKRKPKRTVSELDGLLRIKASALPAKEVSLEKQIEGLNNILGDISSEQAETTISLLHAEESILKARQELDQALEKNANQRQLFDEIVKEVRSQSDLRAELIASVKALGGNVDAFVEDQKVKKILNDPNTKTAAVEVEKGSKGDGRSDSGKYNLKQYSAEVPEIKELIRQIRATEQFAKLQQETLDEKEGMLADLQRRLIQSQHDTARLVKKGDLLLTINGEYANEIVELRYHKDELESLGPLHACVEANPKYPPVSLMQEWADANLKGRVIILGAAFKNAARSSYEHPEHIYEVLELLANEYWEQKMSGGCENTSELRRQFARRLDESYLSIGKSITRIGDKIRPKYEVFHDGEKYFLDQHIGRGSSRDPQHCLRIYFTWLEDRNQVLVGHMPNHLPTYDS